MIKKVLKKSNFILSAITNLLYIYLRLVYFTSSWQFIFSAGYNKKKFLTERGVIFTFWHNRLALGPGMFLGHQGIYALISPHSDGKIISKIVTKFGFGVISGSTNKGQVAALKTIIKKLGSGCNIVITPDGPRGPIYQINSSINKVAHNYNIKVIPISCSSSRHVVVNSWDKLIMPLPFSRVIVTIGRPIRIKGDEQQDNINLQRTLMELT